ncbi:DUF4097 family beta strand repeat-containing protein [Legionella saoudiensis]|uniref:hypothetical protein n=1 Tax=Legionella saoudiensis TaxID=1750561 RepID=UPI000730B1CE|nr:hypothetical protein [Legionella saoudiensis]
MQGLFEFFFGPRRPSITHTGTDDIELDEIANDTNFIRKGSGLTTVNGTVGYNVKIDISEGDVIIRGNIGGKCLICKDGNGALTIDGDVARDLKLTLYGQGTVYFTRKPHADVINSIRRESVNAQIYCAGRLLLAPNPSYVHHNMGRSTETRVVEVERIVERVVVRNVPVPSPSQQAFEDKYDKDTQIYIDGQRKYETIAARIEKLGTLSPEEERLLAVFTDPITLDYFNDVPVCYKEKYYNLSTLLQIGMDPMSREALMLYKINPARTLVNNFEEIMDKIQINRKEAVANSESVEEESNFRP